MIDLGGMLASFWEQCRCCVRVQACVKFLRIVVHMYFCLSGVCFFRAEGGQLCDHVPGSVQGPSRSDFGTHLVMIAAALLVSFKFQVGLFL